MTTLSIELVMNGNSVDQDASTAAFEAALSSFVAQHEVESTTIGAAVSAIFDKHLGKNIKLETLGSLVAMELNATPDNFNVLSALAKDYVRQNSGNGATYQIRKGAGGGVARIADLPVDSK